jgi:gas vesicle structural protein
VSVMQRESSAGYLTRAPRSSGLADVLEILLDRGLVIDAYVRVSLVGIELLTIDLRVVIASVDTYLRFAEAVNRLDLQASDDSKSLPQLMGVDGGDDDGGGDQDEGEDEGRSRSRSRSRSGNR